MSTSTYGASFVARLDERLYGTAIGPDHPDYDGARRGHNQSFDYRPALIARCVDADDVSTAVRFAAAEGLELAVRGGGHSLAGFCSLDGGLVVDLTQMRSAQVDPESSTAAVGGGTTAGDLDRATHEFGLATPSATVSTVGMAGFTLGGGIGHLVRAFGLAADNLIGANVVLADGRRVRADEESEPELFWALRGGGGNFGAVTELRYRLHPVCTVIGGPMLWELADTAEVLELYRRWLPEQPNEVSAFFAVMVVPPADPFPEAIRLRPVCALVWCNTGTPKLANGAVDAFRAAAPAPLLDVVTELPYPALQSAFDPIAAIGTHNYISGQCYRSLPGEAAAEFVRFGERAPSWLSSTTCTRSMARLPARAIATRPGHGATRRSRRCSSALPMSRATTARCGSGRASSPPGWTLTRSAGPTPTSSWTRDPTLPAPATATTTSGLLRSKRGTTRTTCSTTTKTSLLKAPDGSSTRGVSPTWSPNGIENGACPLRRSCVGEM